MTFPWTSKILVFIIQLLLCIDTIFIVSLWALTKCCEMEARITENDPKNDGLSTLTSQATSNKMMTKIPNKLLDQIQKQLAVGGIG